jgi:hypothetical protein
MEYPQYRKYNDSKSYFKITDFDKLEEKKILGSKVIVFELHAVTYYEKFQIKDLLDANRDGIEVISKAEYESIISNTVLP